MKCYFKCSRCSHHCHKMYSILLNHVLLVIYIDTTILSLAFFSIFCPTSD
ncbi:hypothetical protein A1OE_681 [Candidatus Endolissoclinum faulkneri L2]|uniref:Uncharacterized protein n=1 Tax=Candidatus Endolissoclinum faulkneri L2 TaxID=1193729 RepID=K7YQP1_9PROT|nr:hypothetical protein A1OE_681 [Candidatus Endolissoclinum faulkneri L2]